MPHRRSNHKWLASLFTIYCVIRDGKPAESATGDRFILKTGVGETIGIEP